MCMLVSDVALPCLRGVCAHVGSERTVSVLVLNRVSVVGSRGLCPSGSVGCVCRCWLLRSVRAHLGQRIVCLLVLRGVYSCAVPVLGSVVVYPCFFLRGVCASVVF